MGLWPEMLDYIERCVLASVGELAGKNMLELGNQRIKVPSIEEKTGRGYYERRGVAHTAFDLNGRDGAIPVDLAKPDTGGRWHGRFDIVTNSGTTEHIEPHEAQYDVFRNIHAWLRPEGVAIHMVPDVHALEQDGAWDGHCNNYYSLEFFELLGKQCGYRLVLPERIAGQVCVGLQKDGDTPFGGERGALLAAIARRDGGKVYSGINDGSARNRLLRSLRVRAHRALQNVLRTR